MIPTASDLSVLPPSFAVLYGRRCAGRVRVVLDESPVSVRDEVTNVLATFDRIDNVSANELTTTLLRIIELSADRRTWQWNGMYVVATISGCVYCMLAAIALEESKADIWHEKIFGAASEVGKSSLSALEKIVPGSAVKRRLEKLLESDFRKLKALSMTKATVEDLTEMLGPLWGEDGVPRKRGRSK